MASFTYRLGVRSGSKLKSVCSRLVCGGNNVGVPKVFSRASSYYPIDDSLYNLTDEQKQVNISLTYDLDLYLK